MYLWTTIVREPGALESARVEPCLVCQFGLLVASVDSMREGAGNGTCLLIAAMDDGGVGRGGGYVAEVQIMCRTEQVESAKLGT